ncbi:MAG: ribonuclease HI [Proteobacteria bacterium]|nr:ribonuclease HI [Pseudomonadota bacterium]
MKKVTVITDGACLDNPGPGGWAALLRFGEHEKMIAGCEADTTNNRMELMAAIRGLEALKESCDVVLVADSRYVLDAFEKNWLHKWRQNGWKTAGNKPVKNQDLWEQLDVQIQRHKLSYRWVRGHDGHADNERVDQEARKAALALKQGLKSLPGETLP